MCLLQVSLIEVKLPLNKLQIFHISAIINIRIICTIQSTKKLSFEGKGDFGTTKAKSSETKSKLKIPQIV